MNSPKPPDSTPAPADESSVDREAARDPGTLSTQARTRSEAPDTDVDPRFDGTILRMATSETIAATDAPAAITVPAPPPEKEPAPGDVVGAKYRLDTLIGAGGMGKVYAATHLELDARVALKLMHSFVVGLPEHSQRFRREARAASRINHENIVRVLDFGVEGETHYIVMEYVDGISLGDWLEPQAAPPDFDVVIPIVLQLLDALSAAHDAGVVHRDLKPDNVILTENQFGAPLAKVTDFGLARYEDPQDQGVTFTKDDAVAGTPGYMSPEQCRSLKVGPAADLYAFGCILTELLQLSPPFTAETAMDVMSQQLFMPPGPLERPAHSQPMPELLERLRLDLLAKAIHKRPQSAAEVRRRLIEALDPTAAETQLPARKGEPPLGGRGDRIPRWNRDGPTRSVESSDVGSLVSVIAPAGGETCFDATLLTGLAAQGMTVQQVNHPKDAETAVIVVDGGEDTVEALRLLTEVRSLHARSTAVVCIGGATQATLNGLIEAGAREIVRLPTTPDVMARHLRRALKHADRQRSAHTAQSD